MRYKELIDNLNYWKSVSDEENPEIVVVNDDITFEIEGIGASYGIDSLRAIGIYFYDE